ncbi:MAG: peptide-methionine (R)-S-oxide reductase MsrB [Planctomycetota bacterium]
MNDYKGREMSDLAVQVTQHSGTERPFTGTYTDDERPGVYRCIVCGTVLFDAAAKFHSGCGWPSFDDVKEQGKIKEVPDASLPGRPRIEVRCNKCDAHLGHVFNDGPTNTGLRYCINSVAIDLESAAD